MRGDHGNLRQPVASEISDIVLNRNGTERADRQRSHLRLALRPGRIAQPSPVAREVLPRPRRSDEAAHPPAAGGERRALGGGGREGPRGAAGHRFEPPPPPAPVGVPPEPPPHTPGHLP